jgi:hypothetical protein
MGEDGAMTVDHTLTELLDGLASPDPGTRDGWALEELADGILEDRWSEHELDRIAAVCLERLAAPRAEVRSFAALVLTVLVEAGHGRAAWVAPVTSWWLTEDDERGWDETLGWVHAVAHGADLVAALGRADLAHPARLLEVLAARALTPVAATWRDLEEARLAHASVLLLEGVTDEQAATRWVDPLYDAAVAAGASGERTPVGTLNAVRMLRCLVLALTGDVVDGERTVTVPAAAAVVGRAREVCAALTPWSWRAGRG